MQPVRHRGSVESTPRKLPPLPIPPLDHTCSRFLEISKPLLTADEFKEAQEDVQQFKTGDGPRLDALLREWRSEEGSRSYIERCVPRPVLWRGLSATCARLRSTAARLRIGTLTDVEW